MDRETHRKRNKDATHPTKSAFRKLRDRKPHRPEAQPQSSSSSIRGKEDGSETVRVQRRAADEAVNKSSAEEEHPAKNFTVTDVGAGGKLYLKPSRMPPPKLSLFPASPPGTSHGPPLGADHPGWPRVRQSNASGAWTPRRMRSTAANPDVPMSVPPLSLANHARRRTRSQSFSDMTSRSPTYDSSDFGLLPNGAETLPRPKSFTNLPTNLLDLQIPNYRIGSPRFSEKGTPYIHNSVRNSLRTVTTDGMRSSVLSRADAERLNPAPSGARPSFASQDTFLHPSRACDASSSSRRGTRTAKVLITPSLFDELESSAGDMILAATPGRLIAQITSPQFLDYELLADFFLTFRCFMSSLEVLEYLFARMQWAIASGHDGGPIVRVRTFVALRHWMLNYFGDDFLPDFALRQRFCDLANGIAKDLRERADRGGSDMSIISELKKCWRRTCALSWPSSDALSTADADIVPGGEEIAAPPATSPTKLPLSTRPNSERVPVMGVAQIRVPSRPQTPEYRTRYTMTALGPGGSLATRALTASVPDSPPMSEQSFEVLSCSVPFLRYGRAATRPKLPIGATHSATSPRTPTQADTAHSRPVHRHKRSGSFSDALRDQRTPLPTNQPEAVELQQIPAMNLTGGLLLRGVLLQPSPASVDAMIPASHVSNPNEVHFAGIDETAAADRQSSSHGVKKIVGEVRRALSSRKAQSEASSRTRLSNLSSESRLSVAMSSAASDRKPGSVSQPPSGPPWMDILAARAETAYQQAVEDARQSDLMPVGSTDGMREHEALPGSQEQGSTRAGSNRAHSRITTSSRSILIGDGTGHPMPANPQLPVDSATPMSSAKKPMPLFRTKSELLEYALPVSPALGRYPGTHTTHTSGTSSLWGASDPRFHDNLSVPEHWKNPARSTYSGGRFPAEDFTLRKSASAHPAGMSTTPAAHPLRRRPGGDLKATDRVHQLETLPRSYSVGTLSTASPSHAPSPARLRELAGTHFSSHGLGTLWALPSASSRTSGLRNALSLLETPFTQPRVRASFEAEALRLKGLPEVGMHGGIEDALLKLEGKSPSDSMLEEKARSGREEETSPETAPPRGIRPLTETQGASIYRLSSNESESPQMLARISRFPIDPYARAMDSPVGPADPGSDGWSKPGSTRRSVTSGGSFLLDDNQSLSDISTEMADPPDNDDEGIRSFFFDDTKDDASIASRPYQMSPPTPPSASGAQSAYHPRSVLHDASATMPTLRSAASAPKLGPSAASPLPQQHSSPVVPPAPLQIPPHTPFILSFPTQLLAAQLTLLEPSALSTLAYPDLLALGLSHHSHPPPATNWVIYLRSTIGAHASTLDLLIARFNLVVRWAVSAVLLSGPGPAERARVITKYIHIAALLRKMRNWASVYQIVLALGSADLAGLRGSWALVGQREKSVLKGLEELCSPLRNFGNLRKEMDAALSAAGDGGACVPFLGVYTHDLMMNAQKPAYLTGESGGEVLVNFERWQMAAGIVKSLLRLVEKSGRYTLVPHAEVLSRCLWLAALEEEEVAERVRELGTVG